jgi:integrase
MNEDILQEWSWPIHRNAYDNTVALSEDELSFLTGEPIERVNYSGPRWPDLLPVRRLIEPLEDVFLYIDVAKHKRNQLMSILLREIGKRQVSFWGWTDQDWLDVAARNRYFTGWLIAAAFLLCDFRGLYSLPKRSHVFSSLAKRVFGKHRLNVINTQIQKELEALGYKGRTRRLVPLTVSHLLLSVQSPCVEDISIDAFRDLQKANTNPVGEDCLTAVSRAFVLRGILAEPLNRLAQARYVDDCATLLENVGPEWARVAKYWYDHSTASLKVRLCRYYRILSIGRWLRAKHPQIESPDQWTRTTAADAVVMLTQETSGEWSHYQERIRNFGKPYAPRTRIAGMTSLRVFFQDLQQWDVIPRRFDPYRAFRAPRSISCLLERNPRVLADDVWAKLIWAGLNLVPTDLPGQGGRGGGYHMYPFSYVRAVTMVWLFAGLRWNEIRRLRLGCIRWQEDSSAQRVCLLSVPVNKTSTAFVKPVDKLVGEAIEAWEK